LGWAGCPTARYQNWSDFTTLLAPTSQDGANEIRRPFWARSCGAGGGSVAQVGQARLAAVRQAFNHLFLPSSLHSHLAPSRARRSRGLLLFVRRRWSRSGSTSQRGLLERSFRPRGRTLADKNAPSFSCNVWLCTRGQISKSSVWSERGKPPRRCRPYDSMRAWEAPGAAAGVARASVGRETRRQVSAGSASYMCRSPVPCHCTLTLDIYCGSSS